MGAFDSAAIFVKAYDVNRNIGILCMEYTYIFSTRRYQKQHSNLLHNIEGGSILNRLFFHVALEKYRKEEKD